MHTEPKVHPNVVAIISQATTYHQSLAIRDLGHGPSLLDNGQIKFSLKITYYFSEWIKARALAKTTIKVIYNILYSNIFCKHGIPLTKIMNNGLQFANKKIKEFCLSQRTHLMCNKQVETANKQILNRLKEKVK